MDGFLGRPSLPDDQRHSRLTAADRPDGFGPEWQPAVFGITVDNTPPSPAQALVRVAAEDFPTEALAFSMPPFQDIHPIDIEHVTDARWAVVTAPVGIIGFGVAGILAGALAHAADRATSVWQIDLLLFDATAFATIQMLREPDRATMARLRARLGIW